MPSLQSRLINFMLRNRHLLKFRFKKEIIDWNTSIPAMREEQEGTTRRMASRAPEGITFEPVLSDEISAEWLHPENGMPDRAILYVHGGGYVSGSINDHRLIVAKLVKECQVNTLLYNYRLAPEHPYPAAVEDSVAAYRWLLEQGFAPDKIMIVGESAGGGLCLALLLALRDQSIPLPAGAVAISPWTDLACTGESYRSKAKVCLSPEGSWTVYSKYYAGDADRTTPWLSPLYGDLHGLPPLLIQVGDDEILRDDSIRFAEKAKAAGGNVRLRVEKGMVHCYPLLAPMFPEATQSMNEICAFIQQHLS